MNFTILGRNITITTDQLRAGLGILILILLAWQLYSTTWPSVETYLAKKNEVDSLKQQIEAAKTQIYTREQLEARFRSVKASLGVVQSRFPLRNQILSILLVDLSEIFKSAGTYLVNFQPKPFVRIEQGNVRNLGKMEIGITARGPYPAIISLFDKLARYESILRIEDPILSPEAPSGGEGEVQGAGQLTAAGLPKSRNMLTAAFTLSTYALDQ